MLYIPIKVPDISLSETHPFATAAINFFIAEEMINKIVAHTVKCKYQYQYKFYKKVVDSTKFHALCDRMTITPKRWKNDRFERESFEECNKNFGKTIIPVDYLFLDETLYAMRARLTFKQYNPDKLTILLYIYLV